VQEAIAADAEIHKNCLDARLDINDASFVNIADIAFVGSAFDVELFKNAILQNSDATFFGLQDINKHFLFHAG
jgi:hypothetical protein